MGLKQRRFKLSRITRLLIASIVSCTAFALRMGFAVAAGGAPSERAWASAKAVLRPMGDCYLWAPGLVGMNVISDLIIGFAYVAIAVTLSYLVFRARRNIPFHSMILAFGAFLLAGSATHLVALWTVWNADHWFTVGIKLFAALASLATAIILPTLVPRVLSLIEAAKVSSARKEELAHAHQELQAVYAKVKELDRLKSQFFANISHELRTPLALIVGPARRLLGLEDVPEEQRDDLELIARNAATLLKHVNELLDIAKLEAGKLAPKYVETDLARLARFTASHFAGIARERGIEFQVKTPPTMRTELDPGMIERVILNLLSNAFTYTPEGGQVRLTLEQDGAKASIFVEDTGPGVEPELRKEIFERFRQGPMMTDSVQSTRGFSAIGLGLTIAREFTVLHQGDIEVGDAQPQGARFTVTIPLRAPEGSVVGSGERVDSTAEFARALGGRSEFAEQAIADLSIARALPHAGRQPNEEQTLPPVPITSPEMPLVLVIEDNPEMNRFIASAFVADFRTAAAFDGREGIEQAVALKPDLIITDQTMPGLDGEDLVRELRSHTELAGVPLILLSSKPDEEARMRLMRLGAQDYFAKPFALDQLKARAVTLIAIKRAREAIQRELKSDSLDLERLARELATKKRELDAALRIARLARNQSKDQFLAMISHELRTPLNAILGWVQLIRSDPSMDPERVQHGLATIERNAKAQTQLIQDLLDLSSIVAGKLRLDMRPVNLATVVDKAIAAVREQAEAKSIHIETFQEGTAVAVNGDPERLGQIARNLLFNAIKFTPLGGHIEVRLEKAGPQARLVVKDTGEGIRLDYLPHIFERFRQADSSTTRKHGGLGMGLAIARHLAERHGGTIRAESPGEGMGATFTVMLPLAVQRDARLPVKEVKVEDHKLLEGLRVLVVDDDRDALELCSTVLEIYGAQVTTAASADEAMALLERSRPDVLVSDIGMPEEDGYALIKKVRTIEHGMGEAIPAVALTAYASEEHRRRAINAGFQIHVPKPVSPPDLAQAVAKVSERRSMLH
jgi:signal transduction histidine kinase